MRKALKTIGIVLLALVILAGGLIGYLTITEFRPASVQDAAQTAGQTSATLRAGESIRVLTLHSIPAMPGWINHRISLWTAARA